MEKLEAGRAFSITLISVLICFVSAVSGVPVKSGSIITNDWSCFPCERLPEDTNYCIAKSYAHPYTCCKYIVCDLTCSAYEMTCGTASEDSDNQLLYYSYTSQKCILPSESACSDSNNVCMASSATATAPVAMTTALPTAATTTTAPVDITTAFPATTTAPTTEPSAGCQLANRSPINAAYDPSKQVAFTVIKTTDYQSQKPLVFDQLVLDVNSNFNLSTGTLPPNSGTFFFHSTLGIPRTTTCYSEFFAGTSTSGHDGIERSTNINNGTDFVSRNYMYSSPYETQYFLDVKTTGYSDSLGMTSWTGFKISDLFEPLSAFNGYLFSDWTTKGIIEFSININLGSDWDSSGSLDHYAVPTSGLYFFALTTAANEGAGHSVAVCVNGAVVTELLTSSTNNPGTEMYTRSFATPLSVGDDVTVQLTSGTLHASSTYLSTAFNGFLYRPTHGIQVIWSVHKTTSATGPLDPLPFEYVMLNEGNAWSVGSNNLCVPVTGVYYLHVNAASQAYTKLNVQLLVNGLPLFDIRRDTNHYNGRDTRGRAFIKDLSQGDIVSIRIMSGTAIYSNANMLSSFTGFLLYPQ